MKENIKGLSFYLPGSIFIMLGILVVLFPMLLVGLFSVGLILLGIIATLLQYSSIYLSFTF